MSRPRPLADAAARDRIVTELTRSLIVEAGAGSGKTHEMAARMAAGVAAGVYQVEHMAAITFTRKAAAELRGRFQLALEARLIDLDTLHAAGSAGAEREIGAARDRLNAALANLERFFAGTIHAFCARLLRERPVEAGIAPGFTELDDLQNTLLREESWRDYRAQARASGDPDLLALQDAGVSARDLSKAFETICLYDDVEFPPGDAERPDVGDGWSRLEQFWDALSARLPSPIDVETTCPTQKAARRFANEWRMARGARRTPAAFASLAGCWEFVPKITQNRWPGPGKQIAALVSGLHQPFRDEVVVPFLRAWRGYVYRLAVTVLANARDEAERERRRRNTLSFNDLLRLTARVLASNADVRQALQAKYRWIFVDEFQDTDPLQAEIMLQLAEGDRPGLKTRPSTEARALFVVGDPKQSIYRFRRADIDIYNAVRERIANAPNGGLVTLTTNFRSRPALCAFANDVFATKFPAEATTHAPAFAPLEAHREASAAPSVLTLTTAAEDADAQRGAEAARIARYIRREVDEGRRRFGDFLILTRRKKALHRYAQALEDLQVPVEVSGAGAFGESAEVQQVAALLRALADPQDAVALVGVLRGPFFGLSDRALFAFRQAGGWLGLSSRTDEPRSSPIGAALATLSRWYRWTRVLPAGAALDRILEDSGCLALAASTPGGVEAGDLLHAIDRVRAAVEAGFTLAQAADALAAFSGLDPDGPEDSSDVESLPLEPGRADVVRLMNLHKAKGLEADVVFLADPLGGFKPRADVRIVRSAGGGPSVGYFPIAPDWGYGAKPIALPAGWDRYEAEEREYLEAESSRLLYVAATRAKDMLVVCRGRSKGKSTPAWADLDPFLGRAPELSVPDAVSAPPAQTVDLSATARARAAAAGADAHARVRLASWSAQAVTAEAKRLPRLTPVAEALIADDDPTRAVAAETPSHRADAGLAWGSLVHGLLEHAMRHPSASRDDLRRLAVWLTVETPDLRAVIDQALDTVAAVAAAGFWQRAREAVERHEEAPFSVREQDGSLPAVVSGTIDLVYREDAGWRVIDYKTDVAMDDEARARYRRQIEAYARAWGAVAGAPVSTELVDVRRPPT